VDGIRPTHDDAAELHIAVLCTDLVLRPVFPTACST
jgi:hypothetical protein